MNYYDPEKHEYWMNNVLVPSVTQALPKRDFYISREKLEKYTEEGIENHSLFKLYFDTKNTYDVPMLIALNNFMENNKNVLGNLVLNEKPLFSEKLRFGGKPDVIFENGIIDFKRSPGSSLYHALQLAGQHILSVENEYIKKTKIWWIAWYDGEEFKKRLVYNNSAEEVFRCLVKKYHLDKMINKYFQREDK